MATTAKSSARARALGARLRALRVDAGRSADEAATRIMGSASKLSRIETGQRPATQRDIRDLCEFYGASEDEQAELMTLAKQAREGKWWEAYSDGGDTQFYGLEEEAILIRQYTLLMPGLLQTETYARAVLRGLFPLMRDDVLEERVSVRMIRQRLLHKADPVQLSVVVDEAALHRQVGGVAVLRAQLDHLVAACGRPNVTLRLAPFESGAYPGVDSNFLIMDFADPALTTTVFVEGLAGHFFFEKETELERYYEAFTAINNATLDPADSVQRIKRIKTSIRKG